MYVNERKILARALRKNIQLILINRACDSNIVMRFKPTTHLYVDMQMKNMSNISSETVYIHYVVTMYYIRISKRKYKQVSRF